ncbi:MAG: DUF2142 domain-containing protein [Lachnospiraceae bacterium]|nr:DUF2142 domain-containing protein [Lachnospiraceae bacterium]
MIERIRKHLEDNAMMKKNNRADRLPVVLRILVSFLVCVTTAVLLEVALFQFPSVTEGYEALSYKAQDASEEGGDFTVRNEKKLVRLTEDEEESIRVERNNKKLLSDYLGKEQQEEEDPTLVEKEDGTFWRRVNRIVYTVDLPSRLYVKKLDFRAKLKDEKDCGYSVTVYDKGSQSGDVVYCSVSAKTKAGVANIGRHASRLEIAFMTAEKIDPSGIRFYVCNDFTPNMMRILFMSFLFITIAFLVEAEHLPEQKCEWCFAAFCLSLGLLLIFGIGTNQVSYDEHVHARSAYKLSFGQMIETTESALQMSGNLLPFFHNPEERELVAAYENANHDFSWADIGFQSRFVRSENRVYYPLAAGFFVGRVLGLSFPLTVALAKLGNLLMYIAVCFFAIRAAKRYKELVSLVALLPGNVFQASSISYDAVVNGFLLLGCVYLYNEFLEPESKVKPENLLIMLLSFVIGCQSKPIYIIMACMALFWSRKKFDSTPRAVICKIAILVLAGLMIYNIFRPTPAAGSDYDLVGNFDFAGDKRSVGSSVTGQISYIFSHPLAYTLLLLSCMGKMLFNYLLGGTGFFQYGYLGAAPMAATWLILAAAVFLAVTNPPEQDQDHRRGEVKGHRSMGRIHIILTLIMTLGLSAVIWTSMYVSYTPVGAAEIRGVQGRYFTPLFLPLLLCLCSEKHVFRLKNSERNRLMFGLITGLNYLMILFLVILVYDI